MRVLILTQTIDKNADVLGFMHGWVKEFAKQCEQVTVICLQKGESDLPRNVDVLSLGKEQGQSRIKYLYNFYRYIIAERNNYDHVFVHMNHEYVVLGGVIWKLMGKSISLWYAHGHVPWTLHIAEFFANNIFASTKSGFRLPTKKLHIIGQGIDTDQFYFTKRTHAPSEQFRIIMVSRISPVKDFETLLSAGARCLSQGKDIHIDIIGSAGLPEQEMYLEKLRRMCEELSIVHAVTFHGAIANTKIIDFLQQAHLFVNTSRTGSLDKTMVEAMSSGLPTIASNIAMKEVLHELAEELMFPEGNIDLLTEKINTQIALTNDQRGVLGEKLRKIVENEHSLARFVSIILSTINEQRPK